MQLLRFTSYFVLLALVSYTAAAEDTNIPPDNGKLNFLVDQNLVIQMAGNEGMSFFSDKNDIIGHGLMEGLPLTGYERERIEKAFSDAKTSKRTQKVHYSLDPFANNPNMGVAYPTLQHFVAKITPLFGNSGEISGFFVKVKSRRTFQHPGDYLE